MFSYSAKMEPFLFKTRQRIWRDILRSTNCKQSNPGKCYLTPTWIIYISTSVGYLVERARLCGHNRSRIAQVMWYTDRLEFALFHIVGLQIVENVAKLALDNSLLTSSYYSLESVTRFIYCLWRAFGRSWNQISERVFCCHKHHWQDT